MEQVFFTALAYAFGGVIGFFIPVSTLHSFGGWERGDFERLLKLTISAFCFIFAFCLVVLSIGHALS